jgi:acetylornithine deacetylase/succinyl-diaminopimelate desuccinylase-like protein
MPDLAALTAGITAAKAKALLVALAQVPSPLTALTEAEPLLREFIDNAVEPRLRAMGMTDITRDAMGNLAAHAGPADGPSLMFVAHAMNQPPATMPNPYGGEVRDGAPYDLPGEVVLGKGVSEQKASMASMLLGIETALSSGLPLRGRVHFLCCTSGEIGRHDALKSILDSSGAKAGMAVLAGTGNRLSLGNRGRVDVHVTIHGSACHSSRPQDGVNAITGAMAVIELLTAKLPLTASHPQLGTPSFAVNGLRSFPESTHTIQDRADITLDRRLMPGEDPDAAVADIAALAGTLDGAPDPASGRPWRVETRRGAFMYPSLVTADAEVVQSVLGASRSVLGTEPDLYYSSTAFDQGYLNHLGIQTCNYGPGEEQFAHTDLDMASIERTRDAGRVMAAMILQRLA